MVLILLTNVFLLLYVFSWFTLIFANYTYVSVLTAGLKLGSIFLFFFFEGCSFGEWQSVRTLEN